MNNPYEVLGINQNASEEEIKKAYKDLVKKYHPDKYINNPLADLAKEKMQEVNEAYDSLMSTRQGRSSNSAYSYGGGNSYGGARANSANSGRYMQIRQAIDRGDLMNAESMLVSITNRDAEWFFLSGMISYRKGWFDYALSNINEAVRLDPNNMEYRNAFNSLVNRNRGYVNAGNSQGYQTGSSCGMCETCLLLNCLCGSPAPCCC